MSEDVWVTPENLKNLKKTFRIDAEMMRILVRVDPGWLDLLDGEEDR